METYFMFKGCGLFSETMADVSYLNGNPVCYGAPCVQYITFSEINNIYQIL